MMGQGIAPRTHHPITRQMDNASLGDFLGAIRKEVARTMMKLPTHQQFISQFCPAPVPWASAPAGAAAGPLLGINPSASLETVTLDDGSRVLVVDDFVRDPDALVALAQEQAAAGRFRPIPGHPYPGPQLDLPEPMSAELSAFFEAQVRGALRAGEPLGMSSRFSRVIQEAATLDPRQRLCHRDGSGLQPGEMIVASVHYLFRDEQLGGTVFFRSLMSDAETEQFLRDAGTLQSHAFSDRYGIAPGYMTTSNRYFEVIGRLPARWNRAVFYDGGVFHSGDIQWARRDAYLQDPGRLTLNAFFKRRRP
jgi:tryptophan halogenase